ncbi:MAG: hypothetical protein ACLT8E_12590 [Akkermansia sp.]
MDKAELFCDGDRGSFWHSGAYGEPGDWYGVDYGMPIPVRSVEVLMGRNDKDGDYVAGEGHWKAPGPENLEAAGTGNLRHAGGMEGAQARLTPCRALPRH